MNLSYYFLTFPAVGSKVLEGGFKYYVRLSPVVDKLVCNLALLIKSSRIEKSPEKLPSNNWSRLTDKGTSEPSDGEHMLGSSSIFLNLKISLPATPH